MSERPFSQACENNQDAILEILREELRGVDAVLELGSGTGQHASYFASELAQLQWQHTDLPENHVGIEAWRESCGAAGVADSTWRSRAGRCGGRGGRGCRPNR